MQKRSVLNSPRLLELKRKRRRKFLKRILLFFFALVVIIAGSSYISRLEQLNILKIEVVGNKVVDAEMIKTAVNQELSGKYLWLFPKSNVMLYHKYKIRDRLQNSFKRIENIDFSVKNKNTLVLSIHEREAKYLWCGETPDLQDEPADCYFMDAEAFIFDQAPYFSGNVYFKFYGARESDFKKLILFKKTLEEMGLRPVAAKVVENGDIKMVLPRVGTPKNSPEIIFKMDSDFQKIAENLESALTTEPLLSKFKNKYSSLLYIDLRYGNKVYYKFE